jgi:carboxypeptidase family protein
VVQVAPNGLVTALKIGEVTLTARFQGRSAAARILAVPDGTFKLTGRVTEGGFPIPEVNVIVIAGLGQGTSALSAADGSFTLLGVGGRILLQAKKDGYANKIDELTVTASDTHDIEIKADRPRANLAGDYSLTIAAGCSGNSLNAMPESARSRTYEASVTQNGPSLKVVLSGADFRVNSFDGGVEPTGDVAFTVGTQGFYYYYYGLDPGIIERVTPTMELSVAGHVAARVNPTGISGNLEGSLQITERNGNQFRFVTNCFSNTHQFAMQRH